MDIISKVPNSARVQELWVAIKTALAGKVDVSKLEEYPTTDAMATAIAIALVDYAKSADVTNEITQKIADALAEYVTKTEIELKIKQAINEAISEVAGISISVVDSLPEKGQEKVIYFVPSKTSAEKNVKDEYMWVDGKYELIGSTAIDLANYWSKNDLTVMTAEELQEILK